MAEEQVERKSQRGRRRLVARGEHRHQLVAELDVRHRLILFVAGSKQERQDVPALIDVGLAAPKTDLLVEQCVRPLKPALQAAAGAQRPEVAT